MEANNEDITLLRDILARELGTINNYQNLLSRAQRPEVREFIAHIIEEEKEHIAESMELIKELDPAQASLFKEGSHWRKVSLQPASSQTGRASATLPEDDNHISPLTVGSLRRSEQG
ncbi:MAG: ferritin-like domain-containing protein [Blastocatellia bacterium]|nr:ferritin-like domain-containing protein [Blastocatellia bacterium]